MKSMLIVDEGFEKIVLDDIVKKYPYIKDISSEKTVLTFKIDEYSQVAELCYTYQGAIKILTNIHDFDVKKDFSATIEQLPHILDDFQKEIEASSLTFSDFSFSCVRKGDHDFKSVDLVDYCSKKIFQEKKHSYKNTDITFFIYIKDDKGYLGVDFSGRNLAKRDYKIFMGANTLRATVAYNLLQYAGYDHKKILLDPFMGSGTIVLEAGLYASHTSPFYFSKEKFQFLKFLPRHNWKDFFENIDQRRDKEKKEIYGYDSLLKFLKFAQKNAKIADIHKIINLSKVDIDWIDTKISEDTIDLIVTHPPMLTEHGSKTKILKVYRDFFNRTKEILKNDASITIISSKKSIDTMKEICGIYDFKIKSEQEIYEGQQKYSIGVFVING